jgi:hypothetical protein
MKFMMMIKARESYGETKILRRGVSVANSEGKPLALDSWMEPAPMSIIGPIRIIPVQQLTTHPRLRHDPMSWHGF